MKPLSFPLLFLLLAPLARAQSTPTTSPSTSPSIDDLVARLASDQWQAREDAQQEIIRTGDAALPRLRELLKTGKFDTETRSRLEGAIAQILENRTTGPSLITLHYDDADARTVLEDFFRQAGAPLTVIPESLLRQRSLPNVTLHLDKKPFWPALRELCSKVNLRPQPGGADRGIMLSAGVSDVFDTPSFNSGPFLVTARQATATSQIFFGRPGATPNRSLMVEFMFLVEPKIQVVGRGNQIRVTEAIDENGNSLKDTRPYYDGFNVDASPVWGVSTSLVRADESAKKIARFRGTLRVAILARAEEWEVALPVGDPNLAAFKPQTKVVAGRAYTLESVSKTGNSYAVRVAIPRPRQAQGADLTAPEFVGPGAFTLSDAAGHPFSRLGNPQPTASPNQERIVYLANFGPYPDPTGQRPADATRLLWKIPVETKSIEIPIDFTNLPLP